MNNKSIGTFIKQVWGLTKSYWTSEEKKKAFGLLFAILGLTLAIVYMLVLFNQWNNSFYTALQDYNEKEIFSQLWYFTKLAFASICLEVYSFYLQQILVLNWRRWLTNRYIDEWLQHKTYYRLQMFGTDTDNPDQRISEDVKMFVTSTLGFTVGLLKAVCTLVSFVVILWTLSGPLDFRLLGHQFHVEGYLVWVALGYSILGTWVIHKVGHKLVNLNFVQQKYEADFRFSMMRMRENAESIAFYSGEEQEGNVFKKRFSTLLNNFWRIVQKRKELVCISAGYSQLAIIFPFVVVIPRYLAKQITLGGLMQVATAFGRVQDSLSYFVDVYASLAEWQSVVERLTGFGQHMAAFKEEKPQINLKREPSSTGAIIMENMEVDLPKGDPIVKNLTMTLEPGANVIIKGTSGSGKSTLLRSLAGIWPYVKGQLSMPALTDTMFIPQKPYLPLGTLRESVLYPGSQSKNDEELKQLMADCQIGYLAKYLEEEAEWSHVFSVGEQQRLAFVRALIYAPQWLFLDESTSALDEATEAAMYTLIGERLPHTTVVSVGHRSTLVKYHAKVLTLDKENKTASLS